MSITVAEVYKLPTLKNVKILTGKSGFQNQVDRMGILDYEFISYKMQGEFIKNDFVLSSLLFAKDDINLMSAAVKTLIDNGVSLLGIKDIYYQELPADLLQYAVEKDFSIFLFSHDAYFEDIITDVTDTLRLIDRDQLIEMKVDNLIGNELSRSLVRELALDINPVFRESCCAIFCRPGSHAEEGVLFRTLERLRRLEYFRSENSVFRYKNGFIAVLTTGSAAEILDDSRPEIRNASQTPRQILTAFLTQTGLLPEEYYMGVSDCFSQLHYLDKAVQQSLFSCSVCRLENRHTVFYSEIGLYRVILPYLHDYWLSDYCKSIVEPIRQYDEKYSADLFHTAAVYVQNDGSVKQTAAALFQHENTVRYRIGKIRELMGMEKDSAGFYPQLCIAVLTSQLEYYL
ncbi:PucR family transcriptional regulator [Bacilliculturomica massiliensis]|uniref:PucR family transcriptional regulator n=1 Tax=Bacilliculturomica massiliensis TaxID=1917867 RepID=UPI0010305B57|nr:PucR family transcriptional regulator [Bacilliculturomica massiliensis]